MGRFRLKPLRLQSRLNDGQLITLNDKYIRHITWYGPYPQNDQSYFSHFAPWSRQDKLTSGLLAVYVRRDLSQNPAKDYLSIDNLEIMRYPLF